MMRNCLTYNQTGTYVYDQGVKFEKAYVLTTPPLPTASPADSLARSPSPTSPSSHHNP